MANLSHWNAEVGINHTPAYQVSGRPFAAGSVDCSDAVAVNFPYVTRWVKVINKTDQPVRVGFSELGVSGAAEVGPANAYFTVPASGSVPVAAGLYGESDVLELKVSQLWLWPGAGKDMSAGVDIVAGLTTIPSNRTNMDPASATNVKPNWSGSNGVG
jgi:hypothetical protein